MSGTPIFEQLCRELAAISAPEVRTRVTERGPDAQQPEHAQLVPSQTRTSPATSVLVAAHPEESRRTGLLVFTLEEVVGPGGQSVEVFRPVAVALGPGSGGPVDVTLPPGSVLPCDDYLGDQRAGGLAQIVEPGIVDEWVTAGVGTRLPVHGPLPCW